jgi:hypothetical protein
MGLVEIFKKIYGRALREATAKDEARSEGLLGPTDQNAAGSFTPIERDGESATNRPDDVGDSAVEVDETR